MQWVIVVLVVAVLGVAAVVASGGLGEMRREPVRDVYRQDLPDRPLTAEDVDALRFATAIRGYAMDQVDDVLARLGAEIAERDELIADLRGERRVGAGARTQVRTDARTDARADEARDGRG